VKGLLTLSLPNASVVPAAKLTGIVLLENAPDEIETGNGFN